MCGYVIPLLTGSLASSDSGNVTVTFREETGAVVIPAADFSLTDPDGTVCVGAM